MSRVLPQVKFEPGILGSKDGSNNHSPWKCMQIPKILNIFFHNFLKYLNFMQLQLNLDGSNTDGSFNMANSNSFLSPYEILPRAQENKYLRKFSYFIVKLYVVYTH